MELVSGSPDALEEEELVEESEVLESEESQPPSLREMEFPQESAAPEVIEPLSEEDEFEEETADGLAD